MLILFPQFCPSSTLSLGKWNSHPTIPARKRPRLRPLLFLYFSLSKSHPLSSTAAGLSFPSSLLNNVYCNRWFISPLVSSRTLPNWSITLSLRWALINTWWIWQLIHYQYHHRFSITQYSGLTEIQGWAAPFPDSDRSHCILSRKPLPACQVHFKEDTVICEVFPRRLPSYNRRVAPSYRTCSQPQGFIPVFPFYGIKTLVEPEAGPAELLLDSCFYRCVR